MKPNYTTELNAALLKKHVLAIRTRRAVEELEALDAKVKALAVLAEVETAADIRYREAQLQLDIGSHLSADWVVDESIRGWRGWRQDVETIIRRFDEQEPMTDEDLINYAGILLDLLEVVDSFPVTRFRFILRVHFNDDIDAFLEGIAPQAGLTRKTK